MSVLDKLLLLPDPWNRPFLLIVVGCSVVVTAVLCVNVGAELSLSGGLALAASLLAAWPMVSARRTLDSSGPANVPSGKSRAPAFFVAAAVLVATSLVMVNTTWLGWTFGLLPLVVLVVWRLLLSESRMAKLVLSPLVMGAPFVVTAIALGRPGSGGFPAALAILFGSVAFATRDLEMRLVAESAEENPAADRFYRWTLAAVSTLLFFFGVVTLWPWLGKLYGDRYFWILLLGVLAPLLFFWGRLRQPRGENPMNALIRFNRLLPYIGLILLLAIVLG
jgi:hypothetical protein